MMIRRSSRLGVRSFGFDAVVVCLCGLITKGIPLHLLGHPESSSGLHGHDNSSFFFLFDATVTQRVGNTRGATTSWWRSHIYEPQTSCSASNEQLPHEQKQCETTVTVRR
ncbi:unnamed protein product [Musa textilis]